MLPRIDVFDDSLSGAKRLAKAFFEVVEIQLRDQRLRRNTVEPRDVLDQRAEGRNRGGYQFCDGFVVAGGFDIAFAQMHQMAAGLHFARAPQFLLGDEDLGEEIGPRDDAAGSDDFAELERKRVERAAQRSRSSTVRVCTTAQVCA